MSDTAAPAYLDTGHGARIAHHRTPGAAPGIVFLGGFASDMDGTKATALEAYARERGRAFVRFDYQGHGQSSGRFVDGTVSAWLADSLAVLDHLTEGPQVLVGSSMGGCMMLLAALQRPERVAALVGLAAAPDFTEDLLLPTLDEAARETLAREGVYNMPSPYGDPVPLSKALVDDGRKHLLLRDTIDLTCPVRLIHGMRDDDVPWHWSLKTQAALASEDVEVTLVKNADHRLSAPADLRRLERTLDGLNEVVATC
ncbi:Pimeloyl-ACP methyl ester carboxylesterase [Limimonas halophila]|uniref:Palmitoyl-protein thioesterase ABHD10, mitochondrial n=1 Tax=Limimonas halophila TaxID=1082479 RepID=A0A1G7RYJ0_9PROT|nr:alpha/beta hydrolase [Limimonas halophila]SDG15835.1 Pimeloyl-ACP methyl ester carboxylesterase [Limimonas halophila]